MSRLYRTCLFSVVLLLLVVGWAPVAEPPKPGPDVAERFPPKPGGMSCESLVNLHLQDTVVSAATIVVAGSPLPGGVAAPVDVCRVQGAISGNIKFEVWMPVKGWNGRFNGVGNGALAGFINYEAMGAALQEGYATASTDTGHEFIPVLGDWALHRPDLLIDFGYRGIHLMTRTAKAVVEAHYGRAPKYSYFTGCSGGGQQGLAEAQRYPADYDGIVSGAPANFPTHMWPGELYPAWLTQNGTASAIPVEKLP
jgi:feruloyl esterase